MSKVRKAPTAAYLVVHSLAALAMLVGYAGCGSSDTPAATGCPAGFDTCDGLCVDTKNSARNCGACGKACGEGETCSAGVCALSCGGGSTKCGDKCVSTSLDPANCGACGKVCGSGEVCNQGACKTFCQSGFTDCSKRCVDTQSSPENCGACAKPCDAGQVCQAGSCAGSCPAGLSACSGTCANYKNDDRNCGSCGKSCGPGELCMNGACEIFCNAGLSKCSGVCSNINEDAQNCGACGNICKTGEQCSKGKCYAACATGQSVCSGTCVDLKADAMHCGDCATACSNGLECRLGACVGKPNGYALTDSWGYTWDGIQRPPLPYADAKLDCETFGARLPSATELFRNSANKPGVGKIGEPHLTSPLWTQIASYQTDSRVSVRLSDGSVGYQLETNSFAYRCVWPDHKGSAFEGDFCYGQPGKECASYGFYWNADSMDRAPMNYAAAVNECNFYSASIPTLSAAQELIQAGWAAPSSNPIWLSDVQYWYNGNYGLASVKWIANAGPNFGFDSSGYGNEGSLGNAVENRPFRCLGKKSVDIGHEVLTPSCEQGTCFTASKRRARLQADALDRTASTFTEAVETCRGVGASLPRADEFVDLVHAGWADGTGTGLWTSQGATSYNGSTTTYGVVALKWTGLGSVRWQPDASSAEIVVASGTRPFRCVWNEVAGPVAAPTACASNENQNWDGSAFTCVAAVSGDSKGLAYPGGNQLLDPWGNAWDILQRATQSYDAAKAACNLVGGRLPTPTEVYRVRANQSISDSIGDSNSTSYIWTIISDWNSGRRVGIRISDGTVQAIPETGTQPFRCVWPTTKGDAFGGRSCYGAAASTCFSDGRLRWDANDRVPMSLAAAANECVYFGGHLPTLSSFSKLVHAGAANGTNSWLWMGDPIAWYPTNLGYVTGRWNQDGTTAWSFLNDVNSAYALEKELNSFRCVFSDELR